MTVSDDLDELRGVATCLRQSQQADILLSSGELARLKDVGMTLGRHDRARQPNCSLVLSTLGGSADAAYRLARTLRRQYRRLTVYVDDVCKGAGMLLAVAADDLVISDFGELGPLDLTPQRAIIPGQGESDLASRPGFQAIRVEAETSREQDLNRIRSSRGLALPTRAAIEQVSALAVEWRGPVFSQVDPLQVAEVNRAMKTATLYVQRLGEPHLRDGALDRLLTGYPSHDFVIDREEASDLLRTVRAPTTEEDIFLTHLEPVLTARRVQGRVLLLEEALAIVEAADGQYKARSEDRRPGIDDLDDATPISLDGATTETTQKN
jgi:hypothetical protein